jgi:hypothetical protein
MKLKELFEETKIVYTERTFFEIKDGHVFGDWSNYIFKGSLRVYKLPGSRTLTSLKGFPKEIHSYGLDAGDLNLRICKSLENLDGAPSIIEGSVILTGCSKISSLSGIGKKYLPNIGATLFLSKTVTSSILSILNIKNLKQISQVNDNDFRSNDLEDAIQIINKHLKSSRRISKCKEELIEAGFKEYAKL